MAHSSALANCSNEVSILHTQDDQDLYKIANPRIQAVIYRSPSLPTWFEELAAAVRAGQFQVARTVIPKANRNEIEDWLEKNLPTPASAPHLHNAVKADILALVDHVGVISGASRFMLRILTAAPTTDCGFHLDTVPPGANPWGLLRVYTGAGTDYVDPSNVTSTPDFYHYLSLRERLSRERALAHSNRDIEAWERLEREIEELDTKREFLHRSDEIHTAPAGSIVEFKHLDISLHWSNHAKSLAWIHCSPMAGEARFLVNISPDEPSPPHLRRNTSATPRQSPDRQTSAV
jgi:hypothetical protein